MQIRGLSKEQLYVALERVNEKYDGNLRFHEMRPVNQKGDGFAFTLKVNDSHKPGSRVSPPRVGFDGEPYSKPRRVASACWHLHRDFYHEVFNIYPEARIKTALAYYAGFSDFRAKFKTTGQTNVGNMISPFQLDKACNCDEGAYYWMADRPPEKRLAPFIRVLREANAEEADNFGYHGDLEKEEWGTFPYSIAAINRDHNPEVVANWEVLERDLVERFPESVEVEGYTHWANRMPIDVIRIKISDLETVQVAYDLYQGLLTGELLDEECYQKVLGDFARDAILNHEGDIDDYLGEYHPSVWNGIQALPEEEKSEVYTMLLRECFDYCGEFYPVDEGMEAGVARYKERLRAQFEEYQQTL